MPSPFTSTFASAAAGSNGDSLNKRDGAGAGDWSRNRPNGATQTFRRTSHANTASQTRESTQSSANSNNTGVYIPPHLNSNQSSTNIRNGAMGDTRYSREQMLDIFQLQKDAGILDRNIDDLFQGSWDPVSAKNGVPSASSKLDSKDQYPGPEVCWNFQVERDPLGLIGMTDDEKQLFSSSVNSPLKMTQTNPKDTPGAGGAGIRKTSMSGFTSTSGSASRPGTRRRETSDSFTASGPLSPTEPKSFFRVEPNTATPPPLLRRRTDMKDDDGLEQKDEIEEKDVGSDTQAPFASLRRAQTGPLNTALIPSSNSPWSAGPQSATFGSMGTFGSFAMGSSTNAESSDKRPGFGSARGGSRFKDLLAKASSEDMSPAAKDKAAFAALEKLPEEDPESAQSRLRDMYKTRPARSETNPYDDAPARAGSAALSGSQDGTHPSQGIEHMGFSAFGPPSNVGARDFGHGESSFNQTPQGKFSHHEMSPTNTNPYQSPHNNQIEDDDQEPSDSASQPSGLPPFGAGRRNLFSGSDDRNAAPPSATRQTSGFGGFGGLPGAPSWSTAGLGGGTPSRERPGGASAFGDPLFSPFSELQSPTAPIGSGFFGSAGFGSANRSSRLGAMFPPAMQDQMRGDSHNDLPSGLFDSRPDSAQQAGMGRDPFEAGRRRDDAFRRGGSGFEEGPGARDDPLAAFGQQGPIGSSGQQTGSIAAPESSQRASAGPESGQPMHGLSQSSGSSSSNQIPAAQQRQMVMPDRMRWIYRDPQGNTQGPWSGLEMHDWFKAGFFTAELQVKKLEDTEYEPLAQLVRRIGNSREPFLVPQIGVPHGPPSQTQGNHWANPMGTSNQGGTAQPPFASAFPSFGTTLTAEQQNALERRKQEEQYLMARQKEHLAQQQMYMKQMQMHNPSHGMHSLQHHSSAQSLHSQPSFSSMTSPGGAGTGSGGFQPSPMPAPIQPPQMMGPPPTSNMPQQSGRSDEDASGMMDRLNFSQRASQLGGHFGAPGDTNVSQQHNGSGLHQDRNRLQQQQQQSETRNHQDAFLGHQGRNDRLEEFNELRGQAEAQTGRPGPEQPLPRPIGAQRQLDDNVQSPTTRQHAPMGYPPPTQKAQLPQAELEQLSLSQQVLRTAAANQYHVEAISQPPPVSISPLPAPAAQRNRQYVADALAAESRSETETPIENYVPSVAPWAEKTAELSRGPSLKEIQEAEAKRAAEQESIAAAQRQALAEQERLAQAQVVPPAPGLPLTSTWGSSTSPATPTTPSVSVWAKATAGKTASSAATANAKKTLAQIQKEEESRKQRAAAAAVAAASAQAAAATPIAVAGKRYAELAGKVAPSPPNAATSATASAWTTVGSSGKVKAPTTVVATPPIANRTVSSTSVTAAKPRPVLQPSRSTILPNQSKANEEFAKWAKGQLGKGLNSNISVDNFVQDLMMLPPEIEIISDSVYANSQTLDGRRFAEEFVRRRKLADKGIVEPAATPGGALPAGAGVDSKSAAGGGWSEVAKKGPTTGGTAASAAAAAVGGKEDSASVAAFKVVPTKKKGGKK